MDGTVQRLSSVLPVNEGDLIKYMSLQADAGNSAVIFVGSTERGTEGALSSTKYMWRIEIPVASIPTAPDIIELSNGVFSLADWSVIGTAPDVLHIGIIK